MYYVQGPETIVSVAVTPHVHVLYDRSTLRCVDFCYTSLLEFVLVRVVLLPQSRICNWETN